MKTTIGLFYSRRRNGSINFGDDISPILVERITGHPVRHSRVSYCDYAAIGSIMEMIIERRWKRLIKGRFSSIKIWGSGYIRPGVSSSTAFMRPLALRGKLTAERFGADEQIPLGDPGLLFRRLHDPVKEKKCYRWGVITHYTDAKSSLIPKILETTPRAKLIPLDIDPIETLKMIGECDFIASSSLHGLIAADTYGIPNWHICLEGALDGGEHKFSDYASAINRATISASPVPIDGNLDTLAEQSFQDFGYMRGLEEIAQRLEHALTRSL